MAGQQKGTYHGAGKAANRDKKKQAKGGISFSPLGKALFQSLPIGVIAFDSDLRIMEANPQAAKLLHLKESIDMSLASGTDSKVWHDWAKQLKKVISDGQTFTFDNVTYKYSGRTRLLQIVCAPIKKTTSNIMTGGTLIIQDVTEKVSTQRQLDNVERLAAVGKLASKVAHELNNPLDGILRYINLAIRIIEKEHLDKPKEYLSQCRLGLMRMVQIVSELLEFSRSTQAPFEHIKIEQIIEDAVKTMSSGTEAAKISISLDFAPGIPQIRTGNLFQVFCNLIKNAIGAMPDGGKLYISTSLDENYISVKFRDTGSGFPPKDTEVIFEPFFTTKAKGKGTGLGLAICKDIVERYNGRITAENVPSGGSVFTIYLPVPSQLNDQEKPKK